MKRRLFIGLGLSLAVFTLNFAIAEDVKPKASGTSAGEKSEVKPGAGTEKKEGEEEEEEEEDEIASADIISQQRVNDQFRSAQPSGQIDSFRTGNQGPIRTDGYYEYQDDDYYRRQQRRR